MSTLQKKPISSSPVPEINRLHTEIVSAAKSSLTKAIRIGELLARQKEKLQHGQWLPWLKSNASFSERTAQNYLRVFERRKELKSASVADLGEAYRLLAPPSEPANDALTQLETRISTELPTLDEARAALLEIRDKGLWREQFDSFEDFLATLDKNYSNFLLDAAPGVVREIQLDQVILEPSIHCRANGVEKWVVESYAEAMRLGDTFPPIDIFETERGMVCADGHHRVCAARQAGFDTILATVHAGMFKDCVRFALGANCDGERGLPLTKNERRKIAGGK